jgi:hypothetical protein
MDARAPAAETERLDDRGAGPGVGAQAIESRGQEDASATPA